MSKITLPPLPEPWLYPDPRLTNDNYPAYTAEQMQERDRQVVEHVTRACAELCDQIDLDSYPHTRKWPSDCAAAILALLKESEA